MAKELKPYQIQAIKTQYTPGTRIELTDDMAYESIYAGMRGLVVAVDDLGDILMKWDNGRSLSLIPGVDSFKTITPEYEKANPPHITKRPKSQER